MGILSPRAIPKIPQRLWVLERAGMQQGHTPGQGDAQAADGNSQRRGDAPRSGPASHPCLMAQRNRSPRASALLPSTDPRVGVGTASPRAKGRLWGVKS